MRLPRWIPTVEVQRASERGDRLVILLNRDANMSRGKAAAQAVHAALLAVDAHPGVPVIVLGGKASEVRDMPITVRDAGRTEVPQGTITAGARWEKKPHANAD